MFNNTFMLDRLSKQKEEIENMIRNYQNPQQPVNNFINTTQTTPKVIIEWRILNENEEVDNLYVNNKTLFVGANMMVLKGVDGSLEKWEIKKIYPIDEKDKKINALEEEIKKLKEMINNEHAKPTSTTTKRIKSNANVDGDVDGESETNSESIQTNE